MIQSPSGSLARRGAIFGLLAAGASGAGQTFFIGLFGADFRDVFGLTAGTLGAIYGMATLASGGLGELADRLALTRAITLSLSMLAVGALLLTVSSTVFHLGLALLRLGGQGLTGPFAVVAAARFSRHRRGRGVARATLGFIIAEATYPLLVTAALGFADWRGVWFVVGVLMLAALIPLRRSISAEFPPIVAVGQAGDNSAEMDWSRRQLLVSGAFWEFWVWCWYRPSWSRPSSSTSLRWPNALVGRLSA